MDNVLNVLNTFRIYYSRVNLNKKKTTNHLYELGGS